MKKLRAAAVVVWLATSMSHAAVYWDGSLAQVGPVAFGGAPYCHYQETLQNVQMTLAVNGPNSTSSVQCLAVEDVLDCVIATFPPNLHTYTADASAIAINGNQVHIVYTRDPANAPACSLVFDGTQSGQTLNGTLQWQRIDQFPPLNWVASSPIALVTRVPVIQCPPDVTICPLDSILPSFTGVPTLVSACSPANQVQITKDDAIDFDGTIHRTWTATDPLCGTSLACVQTITVLQQDNPSQFTVSSTADGLVYTFEAIGLRGTLLSANWNLSGNTLVEGNGVHFFSLTKVQVDFSQYHNPNLGPGDSFTVNVSVQTTCANSGGAGGSGTAPPLYTLSRSSNPIPSSPAGGANTPITVSCGSGNGNYSASSRWFRFAATDTGVALINVSSSAARSVSLAPGGNPLAPTAVACGAPSMSFPVVANSVYVVVVDSSQNFTLTTQIVDPTRIIGLSGNLAFGGVPRGSSKTASLIITNSGNSALTVSKITFPSGYTGNWNSGTIPAGGSQNVTVTFSPTAQVTYSGNIVVASDATSGSGSIAVSGNGTPPATKIIALSGNLGFGSVQLGGQATAALVIANNGTLSLNVNAINLPSGFSANWNAGAIPAGGSQTVLITFAPSAAADYGGTLTVLSDATGGINTLPISGSGSQVPTRVLALSGNLAFGNVTIGSTATATLFVANNGNSTLRVSGVSFPPGFNGNWAGGQLGPGAVQNVVVTFSPNTENLYTGLVVITSDATEGTSTYALSGTGTEIPTRILSFTGNLSFGNVTVGTSASATLKISNAGNRSLTINAVSFPAGFSGNWNDGSIQAGGSQNVTITFSPTSVAPYSGLITVNSDATSGGSSISVSGTGVPAETRIIALSGNLAFGDVAVGSRKTSTLTIENKGNTTLHVSGITYPLGLSGNWSVGSIAPGGAQKVTVTFSPTEVKSYGGNVVVSSDATSGGNVFTTFASGVIGATTLSLNGNLTFGNVVVGASQSLPFSIFNPGPGVLHITGISYPPGFTGNYTSGQIVAGALQNVTVTFAPTTAGTVVSNVVVTSDASSGPAMLPLSGSGLALGFVAGTLEAPSNGNFRLSLQVSPGKTFILEASPDLRSWKPIATLQAQSGNVSYSEELPSGATFRFYRFREQ